VLELQPAQSKTVRVLYLFFYSKPYHSVRSSLMKPCRSTFLACAIAAAFFPSSASEPAQIAQMPDPKNTQQLLSGPDRRDIPWQVRVWPPILTFQQRYLVIVFGSIDFSDLRKNAVRDFTLQIKVQDVSGNWFPGEDTSDYEVPVSSPPRTYAEFFSAVYALPGEYRLAIALFDKNHRKVNILRNTVHVPEVKGNTLPDLTRGLPAIEFPSRIPGMDKNQPRVKDPGWSLAQGVENLPVSTARPLLIDLLLDFSEPDAMELPSHLSQAEKGLAAQFTYYTNVRTMMQVGSVLSHLQPARGCVRVSAADMSRMHVLLDRQEAGKLDWKQFEDSLYAVDLNRIDVATFGGQQRRSLFADRFLIELATNAASCEPGSEPPDHVVVLVSHHLRYPKHTPVSPIEPKECPRCRFIYLRLTYVLDEREDRYRDILKLLQPRSLQFSSPQDFRKALAVLTSDLSGPTKGFASN